MSYTSNITYQIPSAAAQIAFDSAKWINNTNFYNDSKSTINKLNNSNSTDFLYNSKCSYQMQNNKKILVCDSNSVMNKN